MWFDRSKVWQPVLSLAGLILVGSLALTGCASRPPASIAVEPVIKPGDCLFLTMDAGHGPDNVGRGREVVDAAGDITLMLMGKFHVAGLTWKQAQKELQTEVSVKHSIRSMVITLSPCPAMPAK